MNTLNCFLSHVEKYFQNGNNEIIRKPDGVKKQSPTQTIRHSVYAVDVDDTDCSFVR